MMKMKEEQSLEKLKLECKKYASTILDAPIKALIEEIKAFALQITTLFAQEEETKSVVALLEQVAKKTQPWLCAQLLDLIKKLLNERKHKLINEVNTSADQFARHLTLEETWWVLNRKLLTLLCASATLNKE